MDPKTTQTNKDFYCIEYSGQSKIKPFHLGKLDQAIGRNLRDMFHGSRTKWQIVFIGSLKECSDALTLLTKNKNRHDKQVRQNEHSPKH